MIQVDGKNPSRDLRTDFDTQTIIINDERRDLSAIARESSGHRNDRELSASAMRDRVRMYRLQSEAATRRIEGLAQVDSLTAEERSARVRAEERLRENYEGFVARYMVEVHKKYSIPFAAIVFVLIGTPLGLLTRGAGRTAAVATSLVLFLVYWATLIGGEQLADTGMISPWLAMWGANIGVGLLGLVMLVAVTNNVRFASLLEALPRALEARRERKAARETVSVDSSP
jgi:lipopolysaccharide export LptBFGC system permease protein LptF